MKARFESGWVSGRWYWVWLAQPVKETDEKCMDAQRREGRRYEHIEENGAQEEAGRSDGMKAEGVMRKAEMKSSRQDAARARGRLGDR